MRNTLLSASIITAMVALGSFGCSNDSPSSPSPVLAVMLKDTPFSDAQAVLVTFSEVSVHASGGSFVPVPFSGGAATRTCDLKKLTSAQDVLGTGPLAAGHYTQVRLTVSSATIYFNNPSSGAACAASIPTPAGTSAPVNIPSGQIILNREFDLSNSTTTTILLDFNGDQSINQLGNGTYQMSPVISIVSVG